MLKHSPAGDNWLTYNDTYNVIVYEKVGLRMLRGVWINLNVIRAAALTATALVTPWL